MEYHGEVVFERRVLWLVFPELLRLTISTQAHMYSSASEEDL